MDKFEQYLLALVKEYEQNRNFKTHYPAQYEQWNTRLKTTQLILKEYTKQIKQQEASL